MNGLDTRSNSSQGLEWWSFAFFHLPQPKAYGGEFYACHIQPSEAAFFTQIYVALTHGLSAAKGFMRDGSLQPQAEIMAPTHKVCNITAGAIATCGMLVRCYLYWRFYTTNSLSQACWVLLADDTLQEVGLSTGICYFDNFEKYSTILKTGLQQKKTSIFNIFEQWAERIFPIESRRLRKAMYFLLADSDDEIEYQDGNGRAQSRSIASLNPVVM